MGCVIYCRVMEDQATHAVLEVLHTPAIMLMLPVI